MSNENEARLRFREAMASLSAAVNIITTSGPAGRGGLTATAVCSITDSPPTVMVCINRNSAMNEVFRTNGKMCINVLNHEQEELARHFAGMTDVDMDERFSWDIWSVGLLEQPQLNDTLASLEGVIEEVSSIGSHDVYQVKVQHISLSDAGHGLIYFKRNFHPIYSPGKDKK